MKKTCYRWGYYTKYKECNKTRKKKGNKEYSYNISPSSSCIHCTFNWQAKFRLPIMSPRKTILRKLSHISISVTYLWLCPMSMFVRYHLLSTICIVFPFTCDILSEHTLHAERRKEGGPRGSRLMMSVFLCFLSRSRPKWQMLVSWVSSNDWSRNAETSSLHAFAEMIFHISFPEKI